MAELVEKMKYHKFTTKKKIFFSLIVLGLFLLALELLSYTALSLLFLPVPRNIGGGSAYMTPDFNLGWVVAPGVSHHVVDHRRGYDFTIRTGNGFRKDGQNIHSVRDCDIITIGDSHTFGWGLKDEETLAFQLHSLLSDDQHKCLVFNGGVPSYGLDQYYLRLRSLGRLAKGSLVIVYVNPINDIVNLSRDIDYSSPRPYACLAEDSVDYVKPILYDPEINFHFSRDFDSLNRAFNVSTPASAPTAVPIFQKSQTWRLFSGLRDKKFRFRWNQIEPTEEIYSYIDGWDNERRRQTNVQKQPLQNAAHQWTEINEFASERQVAEELVFRILCDMKKHVENQQAHLLVVITEEAYRKQGFIKRLEDVLKQQLPQYTFGEEWSRQAVKRVAQKANIPFLMIEYPIDRIESMFVPYDGHTSADGFCFIAQKIVEWIEKQQLCFVNDMSSLKVLVQEDPDINMLDGNGYTRLHYAVQNGNYQTVERLISEGADINVKDKWDETPLYIAASRGHKNICDVFIDKGADINATDHRGQSPLDQAVSNGQKDVVELLIKKGVRVSLRAAIYLGDLQRVKKSIDDGANVNTKYQKDQTALHYVANAGQVAVAKLLISHGADVDAKDNRDFTPLHESASSKHKDVVALLIDSGANVNAKARWDYTPMFYAAWSMNTEIVELLVKKGADIDAKDEWGWTPLHYMAQHDYYKDMAEFLIAKGADVNVKDNDGITPLQVAKDKGHTEIVELLRKYGVKK